MTKITTASDQTIGPGRLRLGLADVASQISQIYDRWRRRENLSTLDDRLLADLGLTRNDVQTDLPNPLWRFR